MRELPNLGSRIRALRRREHLTQSHLAERLGVSSSYVNLIENNRRPLPASMLIRLAQLFQLDLDSFAAEDEARLVGDLMEAFGDPLFDGQDVIPSDVRELAATCPGLARSVLGLYQAFRGARESVDSLRSRLSDEEATGDVQGRLPVEEVSDLVQRQSNYFPELEHAAEELWGRAGLDASDVHRGLVRYIESELGIAVRVVKLGECGQAVRRYDRDRRILYLSELLRPRSRNFQMAHQIALLTLPEALDRHSRDQSLTSDESRGVCRVALANYFAGAVLMPYQEFFEAARSERYDIEVLGHRFRTSFEQTSHRLTTLRRPGAEGIPFHLVRIDMAGNISKRFSASGIRFARFSGACPRWTVHAAFLTPGRIVRQLSRMPEGTTYFCVACTVHRTSGGYHSTHAVYAISIGCEVAAAPEMVYADGVDLENHEAAVPVGVSCRLCDRMDCEQRAFPPLQHPFRVDENVRGVSFYAPVGP